VASEVVITALVQTVRAYPMVIQQKTVQVNAAVVPKQMIVVYVMVMVHPAFIVLCSHRNRHSIIWFGRCASDNRNFCLRCSSSY